MHPMLKPALRRAWRDRQTVQFGVAAAHAVVVGPVDTATGSLLGLLDGTRGLPLLRREAVAMGLAPERVDELVDRLGAAGLLDDTRPAGDARPGGEPPTGLPSARGRPAGAPSAASGQDAAWDRLRPDLASLSIVHARPGEAARRMAARAAIRVQVRGAGRTGAAVAAALSAAGVGQVDVQDGGCVEPWDVGPFGLPPESVGERRSVAARRVVRSAAPGFRQRRSRAGAGGAPEPATTLVVLAPRDGLAAYAPDPLVAEELVATGTPHLYAGVIEGTGIVGPLVLPGSTACAGCLALERAEREPAWPRMLAQWRSGRGGPGRGGAGHSEAAAGACDAALATVVAGLAASHTLTFLDGRMPVCAGARLEFSLPDLVWEARPVAPQPGCGCGAAAVTRGPGEEIPDDPGGESLSARERPDGTMAGQAPSAAWPGG